MPARPKNVPDECSDTPPDNFFSFSLELQEPLDREKWDRFIREVSPDILRGKGILHFPDEAAYFEIIAGTYSEKKPIPALIEEGVSKIVLIRSSISEESLAKRLKACTIRGNG